MNKTLSRVLALALVAVLCICCAGCSKPATETTTPSVGETQVETTPEKNTVDGILDDYLVAEKVGTLDRDSFYTASAGLYYKGDNGMYGVMSHEGLFDTGAVFTTCDVRNNYFEVTKTLAANADDIAGLNAVALINGRGQTVIPPNYAAYQILNDRYVLAKTVTAKATESDDYMVRYSSGSEKFEATPRTNVYYTGTWCVYDIVAGAPISGLTGTNPNRYPLAYGNFLSYYDEDSNKHVVNHNGEELTEYSRLFDDGSYSVESKIGEVFDTNGNKLFGYDLTGFVPAYLSGDHYVARRYVDGESKYAVMDKKGNVVSAEFDSSDFYVYGDIIKWENKIYDFEGNILIDGEYSRVNQDKMFGNHWLISNEDNYTMIDKAGAIYFTGTDDDTNDVFTTDFVASQKKDGDRYFYSHSTNEYDIKGSSFAPWIVKIANANYMYDLVDTMSGETLLQGYNSYTYVARNAATYYVYAKYNGGTDIFFIAANSQLSEVAEKKANLYNDLIAAFEQEGINVTINRQTGELALDTAILFGGDSAELTAEGKTFLNKFIKLYTQIAFSGKYEGFITKTIVEGHTAPISGSTYASGLPLSEERANAVKDYCLSGETGVDVSKIANTLEAVGYSNSQPVYDDNGEVNMDASRRVSFRFLVNINI